MTLEQEREFILQLRTAYIAMMRARLACDHESRREFFSIYLDFGKYFMKKHYDYRKRLQQSEEQDTNKE